MPPSPPPADSERSVEDWIKFAEQSTVEPRKRLTNNVFRYLWNTLMILYALANRQRVLYEPLEGLTPREKFERLNARNQKKWLCLDAFAWFMHRIQIMMDICMKTKRQCCPQDYNTGEPTDMDGFKDARLRDQKVMLERLLFWSISEDKHTVATISSFVRRLLRRRDEMGFPIDSSFDGKALYRNLQSPNLFQALDDRRQDWRAELVSQTVRRDDKISEGALVASVMMLELFSLAKVGLVEMQRTMSFETTPFVSWKDWECSHISVFDQWKKVVSVLAQECDERVQCLLEMHLGWPFGRLYCLPHDVFFLMIWPHLVPALYDSFFYDVGTFAYVSKELDDEVLQRCTTLWRLTQMNP